MVGEEVDSAVDWVVDQAGVQPVVLVVGSEIDSEVERSVTPGVISTVVSGSDSEAAQAAIVVVWVGRRVRVRVAWSACR